MSGGENGRGEGGGGGGGCAEDVWVGRGECEERIEHRKSRKGTIEKLKSPSVERLENDMMEGLRGRIRIGVGDGGQGRLADHTPVTTQTLPNRHVRNRRSSVACTCITAAVVMQD